MKNRRGGVRTRSSYKKQKAGTGDEGISCPDNPFEEEFGSSSDSGQGLWTELSDGVASNLANTVVSLASFDEGNSVFFACTGIIIKNDPETKITSFLTSLSLVRSTQDDNVIFHDMRIQVRLPGDQVELGWLNFWDLQHNLAVINIPRFHTLQVMCLDNQCHSRVVALGRCFNSGKLMATSGMLTDNSSGDYHEELVVSTCQITMTGVGGPLINFDGDFIGMNFYAEKETPFLPRNKILQLLKQFSERIPSWAKKGPGSTIKRFPIPHKSDSQGSSKGGDKNKNQKPSICTLCDPECQPGLKDEILSCMRFHARWPYSSPLGDAEKKKLRSNGYPFPLREDFGRRLLNSFEEEFSENILSKLKKEVASNMSESVVALASFVGKKRCFACTGVVISCNESTTKVLTSASLVRTDENMVADNLKIVVCLPDNRIIRGTLQHCSLNYNIAVIGIADFCCTPAARINDQVQIKPHGEVVAVGRVYNSAKLMATRGAVTSRPSELNCKELLISTCKITKAGIGGPLVDLNGNFIGMNFYGLEETPYMPMNIILELLGNLDAQGTIAIDDHSPNRWHVPKPFWCYPTWHQSEEKNRYRQSFS